MTQSTLTRHARPQPAGPATALVALLIAGEQAEADRYAAKLAADGYTVVPAGGLERGLELAAEVQPDLLFVSLGAWSQPGLVLLVLRSDSATRDVPIVLVSDLTRAELAAEVGGLRPTEHVVCRRPRPMLVTWQRRELLPLP